MFTGRPQYFWRLKHRVPRNATDTLFYTVVHFFLTLPTNACRIERCGWCKDRWGLSWQITPRTLTEAMAAGGAEAKRAFEAMMEMTKIDVAKIDAARLG